VLDGTQASAAGGTGVKIIEDAGLFTPPDEGPNHWVERFRVPDLSVGTYSIPAGGIDDQTPHHEDEIYVVIGGRAILNSEGATAAVQAGSVIYVAAGEKHTFTQITEDLTLLVIFAPAYESRQR
jgi:mannose-6-phosphate isomerase-like protein (cupin superfamily)